MSLKGVKGGGGWEGGVPVRKVMPHQSLFFYNKVIEEVDCDESWDALCLGFRNAFD